MRKLFFPAACLTFAILLGLSGAIYAPDAGQYRLLALGQRSAVPPPFSASHPGAGCCRLAGTRYRSRCGYRIMVLGVVCLVALVALIAAILWSWRAPAVLFAGIFLMPFWVDIFHDYYLPDLLHATILAAILFCLLRGQTTLALLLLLPAYLARESTLLVALCLVFACWRRISCAGGAGRGSGCVRGHADEQALRPGGACQCTRPGWRSLHRGQAGLELFQECAGLAALQQYATGMQSGVDPHPAAPVGRDPHDWAVSAFSLGSGALVAGLVRHFGLGPALALVLGRRIVSRFPSLICR